MAKKNEVQSNDELLAEIERLKSELMAAKEPQGEAEPCAYDGDELVEYMAPIVGAGPEAMKPLFVCVNGESIALKPGVPVKIKRKFLDAILQADSQTMAAWRYMAEQQNGSRKALSEM